MKVLIIEDEPAAVRGLEKLIKKLDEDIQVVGITDSIESTVEYLEESKDQLDIILSDIQLSDGLSFRVFEQVEVDCPIIFITAFDQYAIEAFKQNSIDYLLKPVKLEELKNSLAKYKKLHQLSGTASIDYKELAKEIRRAESGNRIIVKYGQNIRAISPEDIAFFYTENKIVYLITFSKDKYVADQNLEQLQAMLDEDRFFRINRQYIVNIQAIDRMVALSKSRVKLYLDPPSEHEMVVSVERSPHFKKWIAGQDA